MSFNEVKSDVGFDLQNRDPEKMNDYVRVLFEDAIAEPEGTYSYPGVWSCSYSTYNFVKKYCYWILTFICGGPLALIWGLLFACQSCWHIWCYAPMLKCMKMEVHCCKDVWRSWVQCYCDPFHESVGLIFSRIKFHHRYEVV